MSSASPWPAVLVGVCLLAMVALAAMNWALAPFFRQVLRTGTVRQKQAVGGFIALAAVETGVLAWMVVAL
jgi:hypothetical protein